MIFSWSSPVASTSSPPHLPQIRNDDYPQGLSRAHDVALLCKWLTDLVKGLSGDEATWLCLWFWKVCVLYCGGSLQEHIEGS